MQYVVSLLVSIENVNAMFSKYLHNSCIAIVTSDPETVDAVSVSLVDIEKSILEN